MIEHQVTCVTKPHIFSKHEHITHIGGYGWKISREEAIRRIEATTDRYYVVDPLRTNKRAYVYVVRQFGNDPYLRTHADGDWRDNLLSLNQCPI
jgi:hypothetical protein